MSIKNQAKISPALKIIILAFLLGVFLILANIPHLYAYFKTPENHYFVGSNGGFTDIHTYFAKIEQGKEGKWLYQDRFTSEEHQGAFVNNFYVGIGHLARIFNLSSVAIFHIFRVICGIALFLAVYLFSKLFFRKFGWRIFVVTLSLLPLGFGWIPRLLHLNLNLPDVYLGEGNNFISLILFPHFTGAVALMIATFYCAIKLIDTREKWLKWSTLGGLSIIGIIFMHPYNVLVIAIALGLLLILVAWKLKKIPGKEILRLGIMGIIPFPLFLYNFYVFKYQAIFNTWGAENNCPRGPLIIYFIGFGIIGILAIIGLIKKLRIKTETKYQVLCLWGIVNFFAIAIPLSFQRKLIEGAEIPIIILGTFGLIWVINKLKQKYWKITVITLVIIFSSLSIIPIELDYAKLANTQSREIYLDHYEKQAFDWLKANYGDKHPLVLSKDFRGGYLVWMAGMKVYVGHWTETIDFFHGKIDTVAKFMNGEMNRKEMLNFLNENKIDLIYSGADEQFNPPLELLRLTKIYENPTIRIFQVIK